jgi:hypothetical protein
MTAALARWARFELELGFFASFGWFLRPRVPRGAPAFTHHRDAGWAAIVWALAAIVIVEGTLVHFWLGHAGHTALMWVAFGVHVYGLAWIAGDALSLRVNRTYVLRAEAERSSRLEVRVGLRGRGSFPIAAIASVTTGTWESARAGEELLGVSGPANLKLTFRRPLEVQTMLRAPVETTTLLLQVDDPDRLLRAVEEARDERGATTAALASAGKA